jgi:hypothetical protein
MTRRGFAEVEERNNRREDKDGSERIRINRAKSCAVEGIS